MSQSVHTLQVNVEKLSTTVCSCLWERPKDLCPPMHSELIYRAAVTNQGGFKDFCFPLRQPACGKCDN